MKKTLIVLAIMALAFGFTLPTLTLAQCTDAEMHDPNSPCNPDFTGAAESTLWQTMFGGGLNAVGEQVYGENAAQTDLRYLVMLLVPGVLSVLGIIFLGITVWAGFRWMLAGGNEDHVTEAKKWLRNGIIGLAIILSAYAITRFVIMALT